MKAVRSLGSCGSLIFSCIYICSCCNTFYKTAALSCNDAVSGPTDASIGHYCPLPPQMSIDDAINSSAAGPLDSDNTFIAEYLLEASNDLQPLVFFQEVQAGFVVSYQEPALAFCNMSQSSNETRRLSALLSVLANISAFNLSSECVMLLNNCSEGNASSCLEALTDCVDDALPDISPIPGDYYNNITYDMRLYLHTYACPEEAKGASVAKVYPVQSDTMTVTIWYNNEVSYIHVHVHVLCRFNACMYAVYTVYTCGARVLWTCDIHVHVYMCVCVRTYMYWSNLYNYKCMYIGTSVHVR